MTYYVMSRDWKWRKHRHRTNPNRHWILSLGSKGIDVARDWATDTLILANNDKFRFKLRVFFCGGRARYLTKLDKMNLLARRRLRTAWGSLTLARHINECIRRTQSGDSYSEGHRTSESCSRHVMILKVIGAQVMARQVDKHHRPLEETSESS